MSLWRARSNPLTWWWSMLTLVSVVNIALWLVVYRKFRAQPVSGMDLMLLLCAAYVFGCAFRSVLPRADVQRICLFDTWLSSVLVGRSVATVAEICFVVQWTIILQQLGALTGSDAVLNVAWIIVGLIVVAECCSWYAVLTTSFLYNAIENSLCFGGYLDGRQIAFARVITDFATFANLVDVFVVPEYRGNGYGKQLVAAVLRHPSLQRQPTGVLAQHFDHADFLRRLRGQTHPLDGLDGTIASLEADGLVERTETHLRPSERGWLLGNELYGRLLDLAP